MAFPHRKLSPDTNYSTTVQTCLYFCKPQVNETSESYCPAACLELCPSICHYPLPIIISSTDSAFQPNTPLLHPSHRNLSPLLISMLIILASAFLLLTFYVLYTKLYFHFYNQTLPYRRRNPRGIDLPREDHAPSVVFHPTWYIPTVGLNPSVINAITVVTYTAMSDKEKEKFGAVECTDCAVCLAEYEEGEELRVLPKCNHAFHVPCIDTWLRSHTNCPLCRAPVVGPPDHDRTVENSGNPASGELRINVEEGEENMMRSGSVNSVENKESGEINNNNSNKRSGGSSSSSQRWGLERGAAHLVSRSFSCGANIFSSRYNNNSFS